jgi:tRNA (cytidine/uridine-2'-O-)-methyltransferase
MVARGYFFVKIILFQPQIPQNTGNIVRTCAATGASLVLVRPLGFSTASRHLKRAGLDYWSDVQIEEIDDLATYLHNTTCPFFFLSSKASQVYTSAPFTQDSFLIFGSETEGLPPYFLETWGERFYKIPMQSTARCLNLATSAAVVLYEALRQTKGLDC